MIYSATIKLEDDTRCDGCPFFIDGPDGRMQCTLGDFFLNSVREQLPQPTGFYKWYTPRPRGCPLILDPSKGLEMSICDKVQMYTVYVNPKDYPNKFVMRIFDIDMAGVHASDKIFVEDDYEQLLKHKPAHTIRSPRASNNDTCIVEVWI